MRGVARGSSASAAKSDMTQRLSGSSTLETGVSGGSYRAKLPFFKPFAQQRLSGKGSLSAPCRATVDKSSTAVFCHTQGVIREIRGLRISGGAPVADATGVEKKPAPSSTKRRIPNGLSDSLLTLGRITGAAEWPGRFWLHRRPVRRDHFARLTQINSASLRMKTHLCAYAG